MNIILDPTLEDQEYSAYKDYEDDNGYVSLGSMNVANVKYLVIVVNLERYFNYPVHIIAGEKEYSEWQALRMRKAPNYELNEFMWAVLLRGINGPNLRTLLFDMFRAGEQSGSKKLRDSLNKLLNG